MGQYFALLTAKHLPVLDQFKNRNSLAKETDYQNSYLLLAHDINEIKAELPGRQKEIAEKCDGTSVAVNVDFASFGDNYDALLRVPQLGLKETSNGFRRFCTDSNNTSQSDPAKVKALKSKVKKIVLKHVQTQEEKKISLQSGGIVLIEMKFDKPLGGGINYVEIARKLGEIL